MRLWEEMSCEEVPHQLLVEAAMEMSFSADWAEVER